jgi:hypothetical protein
VSPYVRPARRRRRHGGLVAGLLLVLAVGGVAVAGVVAFLHHQDASKPIAEECSAAADGTRWLLAPDQADSAATISAVTVRRGTPAHAATIALATAMQESKLRNISYGDRDSLGWGTEAQILDPIHATNAFLDALAKLPDYRELTVAQAAQSVQHSAYPDAYAQHAAQAGAWASGLTGYSTAAVSCTLRPVATGTTASPGPEAHLAHLKARVSLDYGALPVRTNGAVATVDARSLGDGSSPEDDRVAWSVAQWAVAVAEAQKVERVAVDGQVWTRATHAWAPATGQAPPSGRVAITVAG